MSYKELEARLRAPRFYKGVRSERAGKLKPVYSDESIECADAIAKLRSTLEGLVTVCTSIDQSKIETKRQREMFIKKLGLALEILGRPE